MLTRVLVKARECLVAGDFTGVAGPGRLRILENASLRPHTRVIVQSSRGHHREALVRRDAGHETTAHTAKNRRKAFRLRYFVIVEQVIAGRPFDAVRRHEDVARVPGSGRFAAPLTVAAPELSGVARYLVAD